MLHYEIPVFVYSLILLKLLSLTEQPCCYEISVKIFECIGQSFYWLDMSSSINTCQATEIGGSRYQHSM